MSNRAFEKGLLILPIERADEGARGEESDPENGSAGDNLRENRQSRRAVANFQSRIQSLGRQPGKEMLTANTSNVPQP